MNDLRGGSQAVTTPKARGLHLQRMKIVSVQNDHLVCGMLDGDDAVVSEVMVAKPWLLRRTPFDGETRDGITYTYTGAQTRTADDGAESQSELVIPKYLEDDIIFAAYEVSGGTGAMGVPPEGTVERAVVWLDMNADGRAWAKAAT